MEDTDLPANARYLNMISKKVQLNLEKESIRLQSKNCALPWNQQVLKGTALTLKANGFHSRISRP